MVAADIGASLGTFRASGDGQRERAAEAALEIPELGPSGLEVHRGFSSAFRLNFVGDFLALVEPIQSATLDCAYVDEHVLAAAVGLDEAKSLCGVEPLDRACSHICILVSERESAREHASGVCPPPATA